MSPDRDLRRGSDPIVMYPRRHLAMWAAVLFGIILCSFAYIIRFEWWSLYNVPLRGGFGFALAAIGYAVVFWTMCSGFVAYFLKIGKPGLVAFIIVLLLMSILLAIGWPGFFMSDSYSAIDQGRIFPIDLWLGPYTAIVSQAILQHVPFAGAIVCVQVAFFAVALGYSADVIARISSRRAAIAAVFLSILSAPILFTVLLNTRDSWLAILATFFTAECIWFFADREWRDGRSASRLIVLGVIATLLRSDGILCAALAATVIVGRWFLHLRRVPGVSVASSLRELLGKAFLPGTILALSAHFLPQITLPSTMNAAEYQVTLWLNPVAYIINHAPEQISAEDLSAVNATVPLSYIRSANDDVGADSFWNAKQDGVLRAPANEAEAARLRHAVVSILRSHPREFVENRVRMFKATNYSEPRHPAVFPAIIANSEYVEKRTRHWPPQFWQGSPFPEGRRWIERAFQASTQASVLKQQWAYWPNLILALGLLLCWRRLPGVAFGAAVAACRIPVLMLLAPEAQQKYYASLEFATPILIAATLGLLAKGRTGEPAGVGAGRPSEVLSHSSGALNKP